MGGVRVMLDGLRYARVLPPEGLGPCPIAGERPIAAMRAKVVAQHDTAFIANLPSN